MGRAKKVKKATAPLCSVSGHSWLKTTSSTVEICSRKDCRIVRQLIKGHWRFIRKVTGHTPISDVLETADLWGSIL